MPNLFVLFSVKKVIGNISIISQLLAMKKNCKPKVQPLATSRQMLMWLSMCPADELMEASRKNAYAAYTWIIFIINLISFIASLAFCSAYISTDFDSSTLAFMLSVGELGLIYFMIAGIRMRHQIEQIFKGLSTIYDSSKLFHWKYENLETF